MIAHVVFDVPVDHAFFYRVPDGWTVAPGQRVRAPLRGAPRPGVVVAVEDGSPSGLKLLTAIEDSAIPVGAEHLALARWIAGESLTSLGSTLAALTPTLRSTGTGRRRSPRSERVPDLSDARRQPDSAEVSSGPVLDAGGMSLRQRDETAATSLGQRPPAPPADLDARGDIGLAASPLRSAPRRAVGAAGLGKLLVGATGLGELLVGAGRERRALERVAAAPGPALVLAPDLDACARWAPRLEKIERTVRLDSGAPDDERVRGWRDFGRGAARLAIGTRSALLAPLPAGGTIVVIDEHEPSHRPPGPPRIHARDVVLERARGGEVAAVFTSATPSVEMWHETLCGTLALDAAPAAGWPGVTVADTRGILRREALTPALARQIRETLASGRRAFLAVSRRTSALACDECGEVVRCDACGIPLAYARASATLACRLCGSTRPLPDICPDCRGHRLSPFGWGAERVEHAVRRRFPRARVARYDPEAARGARAETQRAAAAAADVVIGTRGALRLFGPASLGLAGFVSPDQFLRAPDFRAAEHTLAFLWAAAERVGSDGCMVIQSQNPAHYAFAALIEQTLTPFYERELAFRRELGYPPFRRLAVITVRGRTGEESDRVAGEVVAALGPARRLTVYPPPSGARGRSRQIVVKGERDLPALVRDALGAAAPASSRARGIIDVEVDPVQWPS